ncbi:hypothetical protein HNQ80_000184 [Anaerosolibacter carboniphilus]|uniref:Uncharacterized protein n=1 Tax=Anaerosolibacter carboniphilus TaxID=1417629 RepID=A0A841KVA3_9FIRM|nr:hypothetical protein [Anaerosolibacter carboniphilus]
MYIDPSGHKEIRGTRIEDDEREDRERDRDKNQNSGSSSKVSSNVTGSLGTAISSFFGNPVSISISNVLKATYFLYGKSTNDVDDTKNRNNAQSTVMYYSYQTNNYKNPTIVHKDAGELTKYGNQVYLDKKGNIYIEVHGDYVLADEYLGQKVTLKDVYLLYNSPYSDGVASPNEPLTKQEITFKPNGYDVKVVWQEERLKDLMERYPGEYLDMFFLGQQHSVVYQTTKLLGAGSGDTAKNNTASNPTKPAADYKDAYKKAGEGTTSTGYRYVSEGELNVIKKTGTIPNTDRAGNLKDVFVSPVKYDTVAGAEEGLQIGKQNPFGATESPMYRVEFNTNGIKFRYGGNVEGGTGVELITEQSIPVDLSKIFKLK